MIKTNSTKAKKYIIEIIKITNKMKNNIKDQAVMIIINPKVEMKVQVLKHINYNDYLFLLLINFRYLN